MKLNLSFICDGQEFRTCSYGDKPDLIKIVEACQNIGVISFCAISDGDKKEESKG